MKLWLNGELVGNSSNNPMTGDAVSALSAGFTVGWGVFTTLGVRGGKARFVERHVRRLERDAAAADVTLDANPALISRAIEAVIGENAIENGLVRLTLTRRDDGRWNQESGADFSIFALETAAPFSSDLAPGAEMRAAISPFRVEAKRALVGIKTTSYLPYFWAWREAKKRGFDEAILRQGDDFWCEGARSTVFWVRNGELFTPSLETGCLRGIGRDLALEWAASSRIPVHQGLFSGDDAESAEEIWLVSAATGPRPLRALHDENGAVKARFPAQNPLCIEFSRWFDGHSD